MTYREIAGKLQQFHVIRMTSKVQQNVLADPQCQFEFGIHHESRISFTPDNSSSTIISLQRPTSDAF